ncbi:MAG: GNAT family protein [Caldilineaceae bacterium]
MPPVASLPTPTLSTARLRLRPFSQKQTQTPSSRWKQPMCDALLGRASPWHEYAQAERFLARCQQMAQEGSGMRLAIERITGGSFIGWCTFMNWDPTYRSAMLGYCLDETAWGQGFATEAAGALLTWAFDSLDLNRVQSEVDTRNAASDRVLHKLGFLREGTLRENCIVNGEVSDSWVYGLLRRDWAMTQNLRDSNAKHP